MQVHQFTMGLRWARQDLDPDLPSTVLHTLLVVAQYPAGVSLKELARQLDMARSSTSRNVGLLGPVGKRSKKGYKLVRTFEDPAEKRRKLVQLTSTGRAWNNRFEQTLACGD